MGFPTVIEVFRVDGIDGSLHLSPIGQAVDDCLGIRLSVRSWLSVFLDMLADWDGLLLIFRGQQSTRSHVDLSSVHVNQILWYVALQHLQVPLILHGQKFIGRSVAGSFARHLGAFAECGVTGSDYFVPNL